MGMGKIHLCFVLSPGYSRNIRSYECKCNKNDSPVFLLFFLCFYGLCLVNRLQVV